MTPEVKVKKRIKKLLDDAGAYYAMPIGTGYGNSGVPDFLVCLGGEFLAIEAKAGKNEPTALQLKNIAHIRNSGGVAIVVNEEAIAALEGLIKILLGANND